MTSPSKIVIDADNGKLDAASKKSANEVRKIANEAGAINRQFERFGNQITARLGGLSALLQTIQAINQEVDKRKSDTAGANAASGGRAMDVGQAARSLGLDADAVKQIEGMTGVRSQDEIAKMAAALASKSASAKTKTKPGDAMAALGLFSSGLFDESEITAAMEKPGGLAKLSAESGRRGASLSSAEIDERNIRSLENRNAARREAALAPGGIQERARSSQRGVFDAENPLTSGVRNVLGSQLGGAGLGGANAANNAISLKIVEKLENINQNTKPKATPTMATTPESGP